jgi:hypothetical protein
MPLRVTCVSMLEVRPFGLKSAIKSIQQMKGPANTRVLFTVTRAIFVSMMSLLHVFPVMTVEPLCPLKPDVVLRQRH